MVDEFEVVIDGTKYLLKRMFHEELDLTYHIHLQHNKKLLIFRMERIAGEWEIVPQQLPIYIYQAKEELVKTIRENENG